MVGEARTPGNSMKGLVPIRTKITDFRPDSGKGATKICQLTDGRSKPWHVLIKSLPTRAVANIAGTPGFFACPQSELI